MRTVAERSWLIAISIMSFRTDLSAEKLAKWSKLSKREKAEAMRANSDVANTSACFEALRREMSR